MGGCLSSSEDGSGQKKAEEQGSLGSIALAEQPAPDKHQQQLQKESLPPGPTLSDDQETLVDGQTLSFYESVAEEWVQTYNSRSMERTRELTSPSCRVCFNDDDKTEMPVGQFIESIFLLYASFPDMHFTWEFISQLPSTATTTATNDASTVLVRVKGYQGQGTHTGDPYTFGPFPEIPATHIYVKDPPIELLLHISQEGVVQNVQANTEGEVAGPPRFYSQIGGILF